MAYLSSIDRIASFTGLEGGNVVGLEGGMVLSVSIASIVVVRFVVKESAARISKDVEG